MIMKTLKIGLVSHLTKDYNLGCCALAISNIHLMDEVFAGYNVRPEYVVILAQPNNVSDIAAYTSLDGYTTNKYSFRTYPRLKQVLSNPASLKKSAAFADLDYMIDLCGGDGYTDNYGLIRLIAESVPVIGAKQFKVTSVFAPQTIGPFNTVHGKFIAKYILGKLDTLFVRDQASYDCCDKLGLKEITKQVIDVAFALPYTKSEFDHSKLNVGINISGLLYNGGYNHDNYFRLSFSYRDFIDRLVDHFSKDDSIRLHLVPHVLADYGDVDDDFAVCKQIASCHSNVILAPRFESPVDAKNYISGLDLFSGARMHSTIAATSSGVPVIPVAYSRKFNGLFSSLEYPYFIDAKANLNVDDALNLFIQYMNNIDDLKNALNNSKNIYTKKLVLYKDYLKELFHLN